MKTKPGPSCASSSAPTPDLEPDPTAHTLTVRVHSFATPRSNRTIHHLLDCLNETEFTYPGTTLQLRYTLAASNPK